MRWSDEQDDVLHECSFRGARAARDEIERRCGVSHSLHAMELRASRIHSSLAVQTVCPECGAQRQRNSRASRRYGLPSRKERVGG